MNTFKHSDFFLFQKQNIIIFFFFFLGIESIESWGTKIKFDICASIFNTESEFVDQ